MIWVLLRLVTNPLSWLVPLANTLTWRIYIILFIWIFLETAFILFSFLPGQSILFLTGTLAANSGNQLNIWLLLIVFISSSTLGATVKYWLGRRDEQKHTEFSQNKEIQKTTDYFVNHEKQAIIWSRFIPFIGLFVPLIAGTSQMNWRKFNFLNFIGVLLWVGICCFAGYYLGTFTFVKKYFTVIFLALIIIPASISTICKRLIEHRRVIE